MVPLYGSFPHHLPNQPQSSAQQPQLGMNNNPQTQIPFNGVAMAMQNMPNPMANQPGFMNGPNSHLGMAHLGSIGHIPQPGKPPHVGFGPQCSGTNMNPLAAAFPIRGFGHNNNMSGVPFGQFCVPNAMQGMNQFAAMQMPPNVSQFVPQTAFGPHTGVLPNPGFSGNQFGNLHYNQIVQQLNQSHNLLMPGMDVNAQNPTILAVHQLRGNSPTTVTNLTEQTNNNVQPSGAQRNTARADGFNASRGNWKNQSNKNFTRNPKRGMQQEGSQNPQFRHMKNGRKNFGFPNARNGRGLSNEKPAKFGIANSKNQGREQRRSLSLTYTEQEIQQWREERRKYYPSKGNVEKKLAEKALNKEGLEKEAKIRREQLKAILAKQAELGLEVAEIPGCSLSDLKKEGQGRGENVRPFGKNGRFQNKFDKRGRYNKRDRYPKKQRLNDSTSSNVPLLSMRKPTLLEKLLRVDIKRDNSHLLQAFRFIVINSFFDGSSDKPLEFPTVVVKDGFKENFMAEEMCVNAGKDVPEVSDKTVVGEFDSDGESDSDHSDNGEGDNKRNDESNRNRQETEEEEEEGEIIN